MKPFFTLACALATAAALASCVAGPTQRDGEQPRHSAAKPGAHSAEQPAAMPAASRAELPADPGDSRIFLTPTVVAVRPIDPAHIKAAAEYSESVSGRALLVMQNGTVVAERYADGWGAARPHALASGTKSFVGVVAAAALADGVIASLDERVSDTLVEWQDDPRKSQITVRELLTLSSGLTPNSELLGRQGAGIKDLGGASDIASRLRGGGREEMPSDRFAAVLAVTAASEPGERFQYGPTHFYAFGAFLERKLAASNRSQKTYWDYFAARVLAPAGINIGLDRFAPDQGGKPNLPGGGHLTAREWATFGEFVRVGGAAIARDEHGSLRPTGVQAIPTALLDQCFAPSKANSNYGLTWWLLNGMPGQGAQVADGAGAGLRAGAGERAGAGSRAMRQAAQVAAIRDANGAVIPLSMAAGAGKQRLYILPEQGLVIVRFAEMNPKGAAFNDTTFLRLLLGLTPQP